MPERERVFAQSLPVMRARSIDVYGRKAGDGRVLSFALPADISQEEVIQRGFAFDGNAAVVAVTPYTLVTTTPPSDSFTRYVLSAGEPKSEFETITTYPLQTGLELKQQGETPTLVDDLRDGNSWSFAGSGLTDTR